MGFIFAENRQDRLFLSIRQPFKKVLTDAITHPIKRTVVEAILSNIIAIKPIKSGLLYYSLFIYQVLCCDWSVSKESNTQQRWHRSYVVKGLNVNVLITISFLKDVIYKHAIGFP